MWRHSGRGWEWTGLWRGPGSPGLVSSLAKRRASLMDLSAGPAPHICCDLVYPTCHPLLKPNKMRTSSSLDGFSISARTAPVAQASCHRGACIAFPPSLHPHILSSPSQTSHFFLSGITAKFRLLSSCCFMPTVSW